MSMKLIINKPGPLTTVQDLGRWGHQAIGMPVSGAMDAPALTRGNLLLGNSANAAALEVTVVGPEICFKGAGAIAITGADLAPKLNANPVANWTVIPVNDGDILTFGGPSGKGCRAYICVAGGIDTSPVMGSRSTYMKAKTGGHQGRKLQTGDELPVGKPWILWRYLAGLTCPEDMRPDYNNKNALRMVLGPQDSYITPAGVETFFKLDYKISNSADRMGYRLETLDGSDTVIEHVSGPDIVSDGIPMGAVQIPGAGLPIVMMADRQTTGGYVKIGVVHALDVARLSQRMPGEPVKFEKITQEDGIEISKNEAKILEKLKALASDFAEKAAIATRVDSPGTPVKKSCTCASAPVAVPQNSGALRVRIDGVEHSVTWEKIK